MTVEISCLYRYLLGTDNRWAMNIAVCYQTRHSQYNHMVPYFHTAESVRGYGLREEDGLEGVGSTRRGNAGFMVRKETEERRQINSILFFNIRTRSYAPETGREQPTSDAN